jgi:type VI secretion system secreted protein Hcp
MPHTKARQAVASAFRRPLLTGAFAVATTAMVAVPAPALADSFLKLGDIQGESTDAKHKGEIDILSFTQSFINSGSVVAGGGGGAGKVSCGAITLMKNIDKSSPLLLKGVATGEHFNQGTITFQASNRASSEYYTITMNEVIVSELTQTDAADPNRIFEKLVLNAAEFEFQYTPQTAKGSVGTPVSFKFNCATNSVD